jgi:hypothetical protein
MPLDPTHFTDQQLLEAAKNNKPSPIFDAFFIGLLEQPQSEVNQRGQYPGIGGNIAGMSANLKTVVTNYKTTENEIYTTIHRDNYNSKSCWTKSLYWIERRC